ncbi:unnamed protein product [Medioppia subpectinata]|uniref:Uncharacterized protein n=1 Tax=Medioppia subpectinata TaxID=1979941 RepID=A0A7R9KJD1_9ACAR|nr:unnamed protein product [Medioppia subpectinata]CAG2104755.1 unnamed protein product [Medioppia subpectinata]
MDMNALTYNPFIYCWLNKDFKQRVRRLFRCNASAGTAGAVNGRSGNRESTVVRNESCDQITLQSIHCNNNDNNNSQTPVNNDQMLYNPFIYCWLNKDFKQRVRRLFRCNASAGTAGAVNGRSGGRESTVVRNESCDQITLQSIHCHNNDNNNSQTPANNHYN